MKFGQRYDGKGKISSLADYVQFNICGLSPIDIVQRYFLYEIDKPIVLLGDYSSEERDAREDDMLHADRIFEIKDAISSLQAFGAEIWGITIHPVSKQGLRHLGVNTTFKQFIDKLIDIYQIPVLVKNRQCESLYMSTPQEVIEFSQTNKITFDSKHLYEICNYDRNCYIDTVNKINIENVQELHVRHFVTGEDKLTTNKGFDPQGIIVEEVAHLAKLIPWATFNFEEAGGGHNRFDRAMEQMLNIIGRDSDH